MAPIPNFAVEWARENVAAIIRGNHDKVCAGLESPVFVSTGGTRGGPVVVQCVEARESRISGKAAARAFTV